MIVLMSCENPIKLKLDKGDPRLVVDAFLNDLDSIQKIRLTKTDGFLGSQPVPVVDNANITVWNLTKNQKIDFTYFGNGYYHYFTQQPDTFFIKNHTYKLVINWNGAEYNSYYIQKRAAILDSIQPIFYPNGNGFSNNSPFYSPYLWARDIVEGPTDYYWVKTFRNDTLFNEPDDINIAIDGTNGAVTKDIAGALDTILFTPPITFLGFKSFASGSKVKVLVLSIDKPTYDFLRQAETQMTNSGLFATTPENVKTNINTPNGALTKALGWFCVSSAKRKERMIP
jgi:hypothetical protein